MRSIIHTGLYGDAAEMTLNIAMIAGALDSSFAGKALMKKLRANDITIYECKELTDAIDGKRPNEVAGCIMQLRKSCYSLSRYIEDIYRDEFGEVVFKAKHTKAGAGEERVSLSNFSDVFMVANNLAKVAQTVSGILKSSSADFKLSSKLIVTYGYNEDANVHAVEVPYKKPLHVRMSSDVINEIHDYVRYIEHYSKTGASYKMNPSMKWLYEPINNPLEIEARRVTLAEERKLIEKFAKDCERRVDVMKERIEAVKKETSAMMVEDFYKYADTVEKLKP